MARMSVQGDDWPHSSPQTPGPPASADDPMDGGIELTAAPTALPSVLARAVAFAAIVVAAVCGGLAGWATGALQCSLDCVGPALGGTVIGALAAAAGVAALAALVLRSMSEWADQASVRERRGEQRPGQGAAGTASPAYDDTVGLGHWEPFSDAGFGDGAGGE